MAKFRFWRAAVAAVLPRHVAALLAYRHCFRAAVAAFWQAASEEIVIRPRATEVVLAACRHGSTGRSDHGDLAAPEEH